MSWAGGALGPAAAGPGTAGGGLAAACARLSGARTMTMLRPSSRGIDSTLPTAFTVSAMRLRMSCPNCGRSTSRPRNMIVILTLWPSARKPETLRVLVSKSPGPIFRRYFISLRLALVDFRRDSLARCASSNLNLL